MHVLLTCCFTNSAVSLIVKNDEMWFMTGDIFLDFFSEKAFGSTTSQWRAVERHCWLYHDTGISIVCDQICDLLNIFFLLWEVLSRINWKICVPAQGLRTLQTTAPTQDSAVPHVNASFTTSFKGKNCNVSAFANGVPVTTRRKSLLSNIFRKHSASACASSLPSGFSAQEAE